MKSLHLSGKEPLPESKQLGEILEHIRHFLPVQGPIATFIHHNTLHSFEHLSFEDAVESAGAIYGANAYLPENSYREYLKLGRIRQSDLDLELKPYLEEDRPILRGMSSRSTLRRALMFAGIKPEDRTVIEWRMSEGLLSLRSDLSSQTKDGLIQDTRLWIRTQMESGQSFEELLRTFNFPDSELSNYRSLSSKVDHHLDSITKPEAEQLSAGLLWSFISQRSDLAHTAPKSPSWHHRDLLLDLTGHDIFEIISHNMIQLSSAYVDQAVSTWELPNKEQGFLAAAHDLFIQRSIPCTRWMRRAQKIFQELKPKEHGAHYVIEVLLKTLNVPTELHRDFLLKNVLAFKGWAGYIALLEKRPELANKRPISGSLAEFLAVQLILLTAAAQHVVGLTEIDTIDHAFLQALSLTRPVAPGSRAHSSLRPSIIFDCCQLLGISPRNIKQHGTELIPEILSELERFPSLLRQRIWQQAFERSFINSVVTTLKNHTNAPEQLSDPRSRSQIVFCIDEREESFRRHIEEINSSVETFGSPGFFSLPLAFRGVHDLHPQSLCPAVMKPKILVSEYDRADSGKRRPNALRRLVGLLNREAQVSRALMRESFISATLGHFALIPFILRVLLPRQAGKIHEVFHNPEVEESSFRITGAHEELSEQQVQDIIVGGLQDIFETSGIAANPADLIIIMGHGSSSLNNPHESAHDCGACGGNRGAPNARLFARFANDPKLRLALRERGINIPDSSYVMGAYHDTCDDTLTVFDESLIPASHIERARKVVADIKQGCARNAAERARRFLCHPHALTPKVAAIEMLHRAEDFAQPRPEYGHATNALAFVGRRAQTKGLFLDRRAFLSSYDSALDPSGQLLERLLGAIVPVCTGISLEYYFSFVDPIIYGCGTKLPHNITGYVGVMDGSESDLRTGLPWQMVEIHEPVRLTMVVEAPPQKLQEVIARMPRVKALFERRWAWLIAADPNEPRYWFFGQNGFSEIETPEIALKSAKDSLSYCGAKREHLEFIEIRSSEVKCDRVAL